MEQPPKWYLPVTILALLWNLIGCAAYLADVMLTPEDVAKMTAAQQAMYAARPAWSVAATAIAVWAGALGCLGLTLRKRWATPLLVASVAGIGIQDVSLFALSPADAKPETAVYAMQGMVLVIGVGLLLLARKATAQRWIA